MKIFKVIKGSSLDLDVLMLIHAGKWDVDPKIPDDYDWRKDDQIRGNNTNGRPTHLIVDDIYAHNFKLTTKLPCLCYGKYEPPLNVNEQSNNYIDKIINNTK